MGDVVAQGMLGLLPSSYPNEEPIQRNTLDRWVTWKRNREARVTELCGTSKTIEFMDSPAEFLNVEINLREIFEIFDDYFFRRTLYGLVQFGWQQGLEQEYGYTGFTQRHPANNGKVSDLHGMAQAVDKIRYAMADLSTDA